MYKIKLLLHINIIVAYFTLIYLQDHSNQRQPQQRQAYASDVPPTSAPKPSVKPAPTSPAFSSDMLYDDEQLRAEKIKWVEDNYKELGYKLFDVKGKPPLQSEKTSANKVYVPRAMLEEYIELRDTVREVIPDDRDFYGKLNIDELDGAHEDLWGAIHNKFGSYDIQVELGPKDEGLESRKFNYKGQATHIAHITPERDPEDVPPNIEPLLPPHSRSTQTQRQFISVHLHFNLSQEVYASPTAADDLKGAELHLARESLYDCEFQECDKESALPLKPNQTKDSNRKDSSKIEEVASSEPKSKITNSLRSLPRYQRLYLLEVTGYDEFNEPKARVFNTMRIDTRFSTPLIFNIYDVVRHWLKDPSTNHGIIVRITNDDMTYENAARNSARSLHSPQHSKRETNTTFTNASDIIDTKTLFDRPQVVEHVRLKRGFRSSSDSDDTWLRKQPSILVFSSPPKPEKHHVKRHHDERDEDESVQADDPGVATSNPKQSISSTTPLTIGSGYQGVEKNRDPSSHTDQPTGNQNQTNTSGTTTRQTPSASHPRRGPQPNRSSNNGRASSQLQGGSGQRPKGKIKPSVRQPEKCSKRTYSINFDKVGWTSWIIAPQSYYANYCAGDCSWPLSDTENATNHAIIQAIYHSVGRVVPKSSCAPVKLGQMAILYQLDGIVQMRRYDDMIVEACGCL